MDYDARRDADPDSAIPDLKYAGALPDADADEADTAEGRHSPAEALVGDDAVVVLPVQEDESTCVNCFLVKSRPQSDHTAPAGPIRRECAADA